MSDAAQHRDRTGELQNLIHNLKHLITSDAFNAGNQDTVNKAFRYAHSLKSEAAAQHQRHLADRAGQIESLLAELRAAGVRPNAELVERASRLVSRMGGETTNEAADRGAEVPEAGSSSIPAAASKDAALRGESNGALEQLLPLSDFQHGIAQDAVRRREQLFLISCGIREQPEMVYPRLYLIVNNLEERVNVIATSHDLEQLPERVERFHVLVSTGADVSVLHEALNVDGVTERHVVPVTLSELLGARSRGASERISYQDTVSIAPDRMEEMRLYAEELRFRARDLGQAYREEDGQQRRDLSGRFDLLTRLADVLFAELSGHARVPVRSVLERAAYVASEEASRIGKSVDIEVRVDPEELTLFVPVAEVVGESLIHLVRNAVDHGIEDPQKRLEKGKAERGKIGLFAGRHHEQEAGTGRRFDPPIRVTVSDDGVGISRADREETEEALLERLTQPGYTTKREAEDTSGRGVGLDVVKYNTEKLLGGTLSLEQRRRGLRLSFTVPETTNVVEVLVVQDGNDYIAIPSVYVEARRVPERRLISTDTAGGYYYLHEGRNLRVYTPSQRQLTEAARKTALILRLPAKQIAVFVDATISEELVVRTEANRRHVYSKTLEQEVQLFLPLGFM
jgi:two-component system chemotaxis sensor kinase CheA